MDDWQQVRTSMSDGVSCNETTNSDSMNAQSIQEEFSCSSVEMDMGANRIEAGSSIDILLSEQDNGIRQTDIDHLKAAGYHTVESVAYATKRVLSLIKGISEQKAIRLLQLSTDRCRMGFSSALSLLDKSEELIKITTGSVDFDIMLDGGIETGSITEIIGEASCGKTQLCHTLAVTSQLPLQDGGGSGRCIYIDTEGTFRPSRIREIAAHLKQDPNEVLSNILISRAYNTDHQYDLLKHAAAILVKSRYSLVIVDSVTHLYRSEYTGRDELASRQQHLARFLRKLKTIADIYGVACVITNQVVDDVSNNFNAARNYGRTLPIGGNIIAHASTTRLFLKSANYPVKTCKIYNSPSLAPLLVRFVITANGVEDYNENSNKLFSDSDKKTRAYATHKEGESSLPVDDEGLNFDLNNND